jgi:hypothetical protein
LPFCKEWSLLLPLDAYLVGQAELAPWQHHFQLQSLKSFTEIKAPD